MKFKYTIIPPNGDPIYLDIEFDKITSGNVTPDAVIYQFWRAFKSGEQSSIDGEPGVLVNSIILGKGHSLVGKRQ